MLGMAVGAISGGKMMAIGRRISVMLIDIVGLFGISITMYFNYYAILTGRFFFGVSIGLISAIVPRYIEDTVPYKYHYLMSTTFYIFTTVGLLVAFSLGAILPEDKDINHLLTTNSWRVIFFYVPASLYIIHFFIILTTIKNDSIKFLINKKKENEAKKAIIEMYKYATSKNIDKYIAKL